MDPGELLGLVTKALNQVGVAHFITGATATIAYGEPRFTNDIDIVVQLEPSQVEDLLGRFDSREFYLSPEAAEKAIKSSSSFNLIHPSSGLKVDFMVAEDSAFNRSRFARARNIQIRAGEQVAFAAPEDVILKKLEYYRDGGSEKHLRDISGILRISGASLDFDYIREWASRLKVSDEWDLVARAH